MGTDLRFCLFVKGRRLPYPTGVWMSSLSLPSLSRPQWPWLWFGKPGTLSALLAFWLPSVTLLDLIRSWVSVKRHWSLSPHPGQLPLHRQLREIPTLHPYMSPVPEKPVTLHNLCSRPGIPWLVIEGKLGGRTRVTWGVCCQGSWPGGTWGDTKGRTSVFEWAALWEWLLKMRLYFFYSSFRFTAKLSGRYRDFPPTPYPYICPSLPGYQHSPPEGHSSHSWWSCTDTSLWPQVHSVH